MDDQGYIIGRGTYPAFQFSQKMIGEGFAALIIDMLVGTLFIVHVLAALLTLEARVVMDALVGD